ncbi:hypothetical protein HDE_12680 [Halotydeus destructor]|nr:hypothetical protein HDE_12680 [Halotydeus destructor]
MLFIPALVLVQCSLGLGSESTGTYWMRPAVNWLSQVSRSTRWSKVPLVVKNGVAAGEHENLIDVDEQLSKKLPDIVRTVSMPSAGPEAETSAVKSDLVRRLVSSVTKTPSTHRVTAVAISKSPLIVPAIAAIAVKLLKKLAPVVGFVLCVLLNIILRSAMGQSLQYVSLKILQGPFLECRLFVSL